MTYSQALDIWAYVNAAFQFVWVSFDQLLRASGMKVIYLVVVLLAILFRLLIVPIIGVGIAAGSDAYRRGIFKAKDPRSNSTDISRI